MKQILLTDSQVTDLLSLLDDVSATHPTMAYGDWSAIRSAVAGAEPVDASILHELVGQAELAAALLPANEAMPLQAAARLAHKSLHPDKRHCLVDRTVTAVW